MHRKEIRVYPCSNNKSATKEVTQIQNEHKCHFKCQSITSVLRQTLEAARNPEIMREMMRNTDRAMSNIESSPEGFNMLRRMYETVQEPFLNATTMGGEGNAASNPFTALLGNQGSNQPSQPATNAPTPGSESTTGTPAPNTNPLPNPWSTNGRF